MYSETLINFDNLLDEVSLLLLRNIYDYSKSHIITNDWEYAWDLDIMNMNFPFLW